MSPIFIDSASWQADPPKLILTCEETDEIKGRRFRAKEVRENYPHQFTEYGVLFQQNLQVHLFDRVGCVCQDIKNRRLPCKHIFAAASLLGDPDALFSSPPPSTSTSSNRRSATDPHRKRVKLRPQDVRIGRFFLLSDLLYSDTALLEGIRNCFDPDSEYGRGVVECMELLCAKMLDPLCDEFGRISVTRGYLGEQVYARLYPRDKTNWQKGALAHGFQTHGGADVHVHAWSGTALELAKHVQAAPDRYQFDWIRTYPESPILCIGVGRFKNKRHITEWLNNFAGSVTHRPP